MQTKHVFRVVVAYPSDVQAERDALKPAIDRLNHLLRDLKLPAFLELYDWKADAYPGLHESGPQGLIDSRLKIEDSDFLIGIFWKRFGTPVEDSGSGTEHEIKRALEARKLKGSVSSLHVRFAFLQNRSWLERRRIMPRTATNALVHRLQTCRTIGETSLLRSISDDIVANPRSTGRLAESSNLLQTKAQIPLMPERVH